MKDTCLGSRANHTKGLISVVRHVPCFGYIWGPTDESIVGGIHF